MGAAPCGRDSKVTPLGPQVCGQNPRWSNDLSCEDCVSEKRVTVNHANRSFLRFPE